ncbi:hypothetical protein OG455_41460 [Kitasatospora sp. NBC_01287]|uniref:hypothetical protein n=1 Tax=Kitasatospora sp. NBC_01287 TaxID=2903573 RepID=UPI00224DC42D|nr:hypothetical protein [Kitasatospora sp. NBC_01287]MCX4750952.1 hypothetical protein [Kitasatospora sp. NBC_01287]MCX4751797.1 hypothetical protein [Kitasatospora sp. NBC_01287]MCX4751911.1 hypothetical protein [Kitasatospora sp. NBC_01287]
MVVNSYPGNNPDAPANATSEAREYTQGGVPAHVEYRSLGDAFDVVTDPPGQQHARNVLGNILGR